LAAFISKQQTQQTEVILPTPNANSADAQILNYPNSANKNDEDTQ